MSAEYHDWDPCGGDDPVTQCRTCSTHWSDCDVLDGGQCAACLQLENNRLHTECGHLQADMAECCRLVESYRKMLTAATAKGDTP